MTRRCDCVPVERIRALYHLRRSEDPALSHTTIALKAGLSRADLIFVLGLSESSPKSTQSLVKVDTAARIARALGYAPHEIPGL